MEFRFNNTSLKEVQKIISLANRCIGKVYVRSENGSEQTDAKSTLSTLKIAQNKDIIVSVEMMEDAIKFIKVFDEI